MFKSIAIGLALATLGAVSSAVPAGAATFKVANANDAGPGSLRRAIGNANGLAGNDTIVFAIPAAAPNVITPVTDLPAITSPVTIDGYTQTGAVQATDQAPAKLAIVIDAVNTTRALEVVANSSLIRGLTIQDSTGGAAADGIQVFGQDNRIEGNYIGTDEHGESFGMWNLADGVSITGNANRVGGVTARARNVIAEANDDGVTIAGNLNLVQGNSLGLPLGAAALGNFGDGVSIAGDANVVGGNTSQARNVISDNNGNGVRISGAANRVEGNYVGTDESGAGTAGNNANGVAIAGNGNIVGGTSPETGNVIASNNAAGVWLNGDDNVVEGNAVGTDVSMTAAAGNGDGVRITGDSNRVGGAGEGARNVLSANDTGVLLESGTANLVQGNLIGTDATGAAPLANHDDGILVTSDANTIGGAAAGEGNVVSGNWDAGVRLDDHATSNHVEGNLIGTDQTGTVALGNDDGVVIEASGRNTIGGAATGAANVISGNAHDGVRIEAGGEAVSDHNTITANQIGTDATGSLDLGNGLSGVRIDGGSANSVGSVTTGVPMNTIAHNDEDGVSIDSGVDNPIVGNAMFDNSGLGIDLAGDGVTANDGLPDADTGANDLQNFPTLDDVTRVGAVDPLTGALTWSTKVDWTLNGVPDTELHLEFYESARCNRQGERLLGSTKIVTDSNGHAEGTAAVAALAAGQVVVATATLYVTPIFAAAGPGVEPQLFRTYRGTSEFSPCEAA